MTYRAVYSLSRRLIVVGGLLLTAACQVAGPSAGGSCMVWGTGPEAAEHCDREIEDSSRRAEISASQRAAAEAAYEPIDRVVRLSGECFTERGFPCHGARPSRQPTQADVEQLTRDLEQAGHRDFVVRIAGEGDPAPVGSLLSAFKLGGDTCVIGYLSAVPGGTSGRDITGLLPNGQCLED
ncbi:hypothetical protein ACQPZF_11985 [Actinosynnema sp. CS-041913]|uniref:hypothetical protein n=1 Tax=Actinosynnema sp. CS-041913 TaxID=3239917 RepID=UPI003D8D86A9